MFSSTLSRPFLCQARVLTVDEALVRADFPGLQCSPATWLLHHARLSLGCVRRMTEGDLKGLLDLPGGIGQYVDLAAVTPGLR